LPQHVPGTHPFLPGVEPQHPWPAPSGNAGVSLPVNEEVGESNFSVFEEPHAGHGGLFSNEAISSNTCSHLWQRYSKMGMLPPQAKMFSGM
jgi:hypothetical protein